ncbi:conjugative transposon protein TraM [Flavobacterium frigidarium]|uniref:Conjugative transposon protein TraM n=1 Tax=Flavobacterium frigidarium TaxID=99286 RepID=A0ABV4KH87_9FLAO
METKQLSIKAQRQRKMLLVLPILVLPFITLLFWTLGGGTFKNAEEGSEKTRGFNSILPDPKFKDETTLDKMSYYDQAAVDSIKLSEQRKKDPNRFDDDLNKQSVAAWQRALEEGTETALYEESTLKMPVPQSESESKIYQRLAALQQAIDKVPAEQSQDKVPMSSKYDQTITEDRSELDQMMQKFETTPGLDPELQQLGTMLENILDIQHPQRMQDKLQESAIRNKPKVFAVTTKNEVLEITSLKSKPNQGKPNEKQDNINTFFSLDNSLSEINQQNTVQATWHETQTVTNGSTVKLRLDTDLYVNGIFIKRNTFLYGVALLKGERLTILVNNIPYQNSILPVHLSVYDLDGIEGIYIPGALTREVAKSSGDRSLQGIGLSTMDDSWTTQAAGMGIEAAKSLLSKKVKLIKVVVKAGYKMLLYDEKQKEN